MDKTNQRWRAVLRNAVLTGLVLGGILWAHPVAQTVELPFSYIFPQISFEQGWKASVIVTNIGKKATTVQLLAYDTDGTLIQEGLEGIPLNPSEQRNFSSAAGDWPEGTSSLRVESDGPLLSILVPSSTDGKGLEAIPPTTAPNPVLTFPLFEKDAPGNNQFFLLNTGPVETALEITALDRDGNTLGKSSRPALSPMASTKIAISDLFSSSVLSSTVAVQAVADEPLAGMQLSRPDEVNDVLALSAPLRLGQQLFVPIFQQAGIMTLWSRVGLFNPNEGPVSITVEAFDAQNRSLGVLSDLTSLNGLSSTFLSTSNIEGRLPTNTSSLAIAADQPINSYTVIGALDAQGLTVVQALTENDIVSNYRLITFNDGDVLVGIPLLVESESGGFSVDYLGGAIAKGAGSTADATSSLADIQLNALPAEFQGAFNAHGPGHSFTFTDDPFLAGAIVKAVHITELRQAINTLRSRNGLSTFPFTDPTLTPEVTPIRAIHITELRTALSGVYDILGRTQPAYADPTVVAGQTGIKKTHIEAIRTAVKDVDIFTLTLTFPGTGSGRVISNPAAIDCIAPCSGQFSATDVVNLTGTPGAGSTFSGFGGDADCADGQLTMDANKSCTAVFDPSIVFTPPNPVKPDATVGSSYSFSFCVPDAASSGGTCTHPNTGQNTPTGGQQPYTFLLDSGTGFPPMGLILDLDGVLSGIPSVAGTTSFTVCAKDLAGFSDCKPTSLTVSSPLTLDASDTCGSGGEAPFTVNSNASASGGKSPYTYLWDFGDGQTSTLPNPSHTYTSPGSYTSSIKVTDSEGRWIRLTRNSACVVTAPPSGGGQCSGNSNSNSCGSCSVDSDCPGGVCWEGSPPAPFC